MRAWFRSLGAWRVVRDTGAWRYERNDVTGRRRITAGAIGGHQPRDDGWLETGEWTPRPPPPTVGSGVQAPPAA
jgi:hypothetical protein